tara:strand:+ start:1646 stop:3682 length:2037 start_codon:yes stop_codon:yes gene_type:complete
MRVYHLLWLSLLVVACLGSEPEARSPTSDRVDELDVEEPDVDGEDADDDEDDAEDEDGHEADDFMDASLDGEPIPYDGLNKKQREKCKKYKYVKKHFQRCCGMGRFKYRAEHCERAKPKEDPDLRTTAYPKLRSRISDRCSACVRMVDNFDLGLLPRLREKQKLNQKHYKTRYAKSSNFGGFDDIVEEEVSRICQWPRTYHDLNIRRACGGLVEDKEEEIIQAITIWARTKLASAKWIKKHEKLDRAVQRLDNALPGPNISEYDARTEKFSHAMTAEAHAMISASRKSAPMKKKEQKMLKHMARNVLPAAEQVQMITQDGEPDDESTGGEVFDMSKAVASSVGMARDDELIKELRPEMCVKILEECTDYDMYELDSQDNDERAKLSTAALTGATEHQPLESDLPSVDNQTGPLTFTVASDFVRRAVQWGKDMDFIVYMYFPGRWNVTDDTHAKMRPKWIKLAQLLDPYASNGAFAVAWIDCVFNQLPFPHGMHITEDTVALYGAGENNKLTPKYLTGLQGGDIHISELIKFVFEASNNIATKQHISNRLAQIGDDLTVDAVLRSGLTYMTFVESLILDERELKPENLTKLREGYEVQRALPAPGRKELEAARKALPNPHEELMRHHGLDKHGNDMLERKNKMELRRRRLRRRLSQRFSARLTERAHAHRARRERRRLR